MTSSFQLLSICLFALLWYCWIELEVSSGGHLSLSVWPHNSATGFWRPSATVVSTEPFTHRTGTMWCLQKKMATCRHWSVSSRRDADDLPHCRILSSDKTEWRLILSILYTADEDAVSWLTNYGSWIMTCIREVWALTKKPSDRKVFAGGQVTGDIWPG